MKNQLKQIGQGMTEYIIIIALIAIAAIGAFTFFGDGLRDTVGDVTTELTGGDATISAMSADARITATRDMSDYNTNQK